MRLFCPDCRMPVWLSGGALMVAGFFWGLLGASVDPGIIGMCGAISFITIGVFRLVKQFRACRRNRSGAADQSLQRDD